MKATPPNVEKMTDSYTMPLEPGEAWTRLRSHSFGRLAVSRDGQPEIYPVNFLANESGILIRTEEGSKVDIIAANFRVAFEVDDASPERAWSVVVKGTARRMDEAEVVTAQRAPLWAWAPEPKDVYIRIHPTEVTGRLFAR